MDPQRLIGTHRVQNITLLTKLFQPSSLAFGRLAVRTVHITIPSLPPPLKMPPGSARRHAVSTPYRAWGRAAGRPGRTAQHVFHTDGLHASAPARPVWCFESNRCGSSRLGFVSWVRGGLLMDPPPASGSALPRLSSRTTPSNDSVLASASFGAASTSKFIGDTSGHHTQHGTAEHSPQPS